MKKLLVTLISLITGIIVGIFLIISSDKDYLIHLLIAIILSFIYSVIIHEFGHFVCGMISGYKFVSFRILNLLIFRDKDEKMKIKFVSHNPRSLGQCLLYYPKESDKIPYKFYNYGGVIFNLISTVIFTVLAFVINEEIPSHLLIMAAVLNLWIYSQNGIDFDQNMINDKKNINSINKYPKI